MLRCRRARTHASMAMVGLSACAQLAACLATPITGDEKNLGELLDENVRRSVNEVEVNTQLRWAPALVLCTALLVSAVLARVAQHSPSLATARVTTQMQDWCFA
jgi:hypothetical protein